MHAAGAVACGVMVLAFIAFRRRTAAQSDSKPSTPAADCADGFEPAARRPLPADPCGGRGIRFNMHALVRERFGPDGEVALRRPWVGCTSWSQIDSTCVVQKL